MDVASIILGWLLGMLSPVIVNRIHRRYTKDDLRNGLISELDETRHRLILTSYLLGQKFGKFDKIYLERMLPILNGYKGNEPTTSHIDAINILLKLTDEKFNAYVISKRQEEGVGLSLKKTTITFTEMNLQELSVFDVSFQSLLFELRTRINILNEEIGRVEQLHLMTFDSSITGVNHEILVKDISEKYSIIQNMTDRVVSKINEIIDCNKY